MAAMEMMAMKMMTMAEAKARAMAMAFCHFASRHLALRGQMGDPQVRKGGP